MNNEYYNREFNVNGEYDGLPGVYDASEQYYEQSRFTPQQPYQQPYQPQACSEIDMIQHEMDAEYRASVMASEAHMKAVDPLGYSEMKSMEARFSNAYNRGYSMPHVYGKGLF